MFYILYLHIDCFPLMSHLGWEVENMLKVVLFYILVVSHTKLCCHIPAPNGHLKS